MIRLSSEAASTNHVSFPSPSLEVDRHAHREGVPGADGSEGQVPVLGLTRLRPARAARVLTSELGSNPAAGPGGDGHGAPLPRGPPPRCRLPSVTGERERRDSSSRARVTPAPPLPRRRCNDDVRGDIVFMTAFYECNLECGIECVVVVPVLSTSPPPVPSVCVRDVCR